MTRSDLRVLPLALALPLAACSASNTAPAVIDIVELTRKNPAVATDVRALLASVHPQLEACAEPIRERFGGRDGGRFLVTIDVSVHDGIIASGGVRSVAGVPDAVAQVESCFRTTLAQLRARARSASSYRGPVVVHLCVGAVRPTARLAVGDRTP